MNASLLKRFTGITGAVEVIKAALRAREYIR